MSKADDLWVSLWHESDVAVEKKDCIKDMREREVWPFNSSETVTEIEKDRRESGFAPTDFPPPTDEDLERWERWKVLLAQGKSWEGMFHK